MRAAGRRLIGFSPEIEARHRALKRFLQTHLYGHEQKLATRRNAQRVLEELFAHYMSDVQSMSRDFAAAAGGAGTARVVADYIAGMTDRFALAEHARLIS